METTIRKNRAPAAQQSRKTSPFGGFRKRTYRIRELASDTAGLLPKLPDLASIWLGKRLDPAFREEIMVAVAQSNACRYCLFTHHEWALHDGASAEELAKIESPELEDFNHKKWIALIYARARTAAKFGPVAADLEEELRRHYSEAESADIDLVARVMTVMNLSGNTVDALLSRFRGAPSDHSRLLDELFIALLFLGVAPPVAVLLAIWKRKSPLGLLREFLDFSRRLETGTPGAG